MNSFKFGFILYAPKRATGGIGRYSRELWAAFKRLDHKPMIFIAENSSYHSEDAVQLPFSGWLPGLLSIGQFVIAWMFLKYRLQLIHDPTGTIPIFFVPGYRVVTIHDVFPYTYPASSTLLDWLIYRLWLPLAIRRVDAVITDSHQSCRDIVRYLPVPSEKVFVIPIAASPKYCPLSTEYVQMVLAGYQISFPYILYVGSIEPRKNLLRLIRAFARLRTWSTRWKLVIVGARNIWKSSPLGALVDELGLQEAIHFAGYVQEDDLPALYNGADLFVFPSLYEGFGLPPLEAMACGAPVVTSKTTSLPEVVGEAALMVDPTDVEAIRDAMQRVLSNPVLAADLRARGLERAKQFSWERTAQATLSVYRCVLEAKGTPAPSGVD